MNEHCAVCHGAVDALCSISVAAWQRAGGFDAVGKVICKEISCMDIRERANMYT